jgi:hypothetical protein
MYYQPNYYGTTLLANFVSDMKTVDPGGEYTTIDLFSCLRNSD